MTAGPLKVVSYGPFRVASLLWQPRLGTWAFTVICKATFQLTPGISPLLTAPEVGAADDDRWLLDHACDSAPLKRRPEVLVVGHAYAPEGTSVTSLRVRVAIGDINKVVPVFGDRYFTRDGALIGPAPFTKMPLRWERAAGGHGTSNPVGVRMGAGASPDSLGRIALPNLQPVDESITKRDDVVSPVGFGPIAPTWPGRVASLQRHAATWDPDRWNERPLPEDIFMAYFNAAPLDQGLEELKGTERILLENLHPEVPRLVTQLAVVFPRASAILEGGGARDVALRCDTLAIDTDRETATLVWRGNIPLEHPQQRGTIAVMDERSGSSSGEETMLPMAPKLPVTPFKARTQDAAATAPASLVLAEKRPAAEERRPVMPVSASSEDATITIAGGFTAGSAKPVLPFGEQSPRADGAAPAARGMPPVDGAETALLSGPGIEVSPETAGASGWVGVVPPPLGASLMESTSAQSEPSAAAPEPPPMIGPLATPEMVAGKRAEGEPSESGGAAEATSAEGSPGEARTEAGDIPLERCAAITAAIDRRGREKEDILKENELSAQAWTVVSQRWEEAIDEEIERGETALMQRFDAAYVAQLEKERGPIQVEEYARLVVAAERGMTEKVLAELSLPEEAEMPLERVWLERVIKDREVGRRVRAAREIAQ